MWSYCRYTQRLLAMVGDASSASSASSAPASVEPAASASRSSRCTSREIRRRRHRPLVDRRLVGQRAVRNLGDDLAAILHAQHAVVGHLADAHRVQIPLLEDALDLGFAAALDDEQHPLLRLGQHDLVRRHAGLALRHERRRRSRRRRRRAIPSRVVEQVSPAAPMSWMPTSASVCITSRHASSSSFSMNGSPTCTAGRFSADFSSNSADAIVAPWMPSRPVFAPT